jgi:predicted DNA-binding transcriptional regulator YafY
MSPAAPRKLSEAAATLPHMNRSVPRSPTTLPPVDLTPEEAAAIAVALAGQPTGPYAAAGRAALEKVVAVLEPDPRRQQALLSSSTLARREADIEAEFRSAVERGLTAQRVLVLCYRDSTGTQTRREVEPQLIARAADRQYLVAWCRERQAIRWFRWNRIEGAELTDQPAPRRDPATFGAPPSSRRPDPTEPTPRTDRHPAGRARPEPAAPAQPGRPRLVVLPGGRQGGDLR